MICATVHPSPALSSKIVSLVGVLMSQTLQTLPTRDLWAPPRGGLVMYHYKVLRVRVLPHLPSGRCSTQLKSINVYLINKVKHSQYLWL